MTPAASRRRMRSATAGGVSPTRLPSSAYELRAFSCSAQSSSHPVASSTLSASLTIATIHFPFSVNSADLLWKIRSLSPRTFLSYQRTAIQISRECTMATMTTGPAVSSGQTLRKHLSVTDGFVLYTSAVLGQSLIVLPSIAARHAGPWSILVWAALAAVSYPLARIMAELGARNPSAGGVITFIGRGLGQRVGCLPAALSLPSLPLRRPPPTH